MQLTSEKSLAGILEPVFAIRTEDDLGIGDTVGARQMIDWCHRHGLNVFQTLPINETSDDNSPYNALSSLAIDPATIAASPRHLPDLPHRVFKDLASPKLLAELRGGPVNYPKVKALKRALLQAAFESFRKQHFNPDTSRAREFREFVTANADWLPDYALYRVLMEVNENQATWDRWPAEHQRPRTARAWLLALPEPPREELARKELFFKYVQWIAFSQWQAVSAYGAAKKVYLMGDIPFGVGRYSADVWANRAIFDLNWSGGAPPEKVFKVDPFTEKWGQNWGIPIYRWDELRRRNFDWWRTRIGNIRKVFHLYRIDHALGFFRIYSFPWTPDRNEEFLPLTEEEAAAKTGGRLPGFKPYPDDTPEHRAANQSQGEEILRVVLEASGDTTVIAEDLGVVPDYVPLTLAALGIPGFRIPAFFRDADGKYSDPKNYPRLSLAQPATHDHPPLAAWWRESWANLDAGREVESRRRELRLFMEFAGLKNEEPPPEFTDRVHEAFTRVVMQSNSWLVIFQITDVFGQTARFNTPGSTSLANWSYRLPQTVPQLDEEPVMLAKAKMFSRLARESGRTL
ncbi:MAG TPA: 4-alpha-glucanotransferase [Verrucomicrobiae bacterium]|nr:4-alpha-glucanotransferase [Verrucomicrobiae bacterium]